MLQRIANGRTDLVFDWLAAGHPARTLDSDGVSLLQWCAYYGDVSAVRWLLANGEAPTTLGENFDLNGAAFHAHWRLCEFLLELGADANHALAETGETPLHAALSNTRSLAQHQVVRVLLAAGADPNRATRPDMETGAFMRDCRTTGETPLHRAAAFASEATLQLLLDAGAQVDARDARGDSPLTWASRHLRPHALLRKLSYGRHRIHPDATTLEANLLGRPAS